MTRPFYVRVTVVALLFVAVASIIPTVVQGLEGAEGFFYGIIPIALGLVFAGLMWRYGGWLLLVSPLLGAGAWLFFSVTLSVGCQRFWTVLGPRDWGEEAPGLRVSLTS